MLKRPEISRASMKQHMVVSRWKSLALLLAIHAVVVCLFMLNAKYGAVWLLILSFILIGGLQSHLLILLHEGAHMLLHPNKRINNFLNDYLCGFSVLTPAKVYRTVHIEHHRYSGHIEKDPERHIYAALGYRYTPMSLGQLLFGAIKDLSGYHFLKSALISQRVYARLLNEGRGIALSPADAVGFLLYWTALLVLVNWADMWNLFLLLWVTPFMTLTYFFLKWHGYGEHTGVQGGTEYERTFIHEFNPVTNFFFYPINSGFHLEHHLFPMIPWYQMKAFRRELEKTKEYAGARDAVTLDGVFFGSKTIFNQVIRRPDARILQSTENNELIAADTLNELDTQRVRGS